MFSAPRARHRVNPIRTRCLAFFATPVVVEFYRGIISLWMSSSELLNDEITSQVIQTIAETQRIPVESVTVDSSFEELKIDSLDGINIVFALENRFGVDIPDESVHNLRNVHQVSLGIHELLAAKQRE